ncbi:MAG: alanine racemase [Actinomycetia bacterium]|nr:alanine racemase [Actinomycetes bacterium]
MEVSGSGLRPVWAEIDLDAIRANVRAIAVCAAPAAVMAVVKADGYGHGSVAVARAALDAGATWLGVALVEEGVVLRDAGIHAPILVLSEPPPAAARSLLEHALTPVVCTSAGIAALAAAVAASGSSEPLAVHLKVDTGMHRIGCPPAAAVALARDVTERPGLLLGGVCTHFAVADEPEDPYTESQLRAFEAVLADLEREGLRPPIVHSANSAALITRPDARFDLVRVGIAVYGIPPAAGLDGRLDLVPALSLHARVSFVQDLPAGERISYGRAYRLDRPTRVAVVPLGYADGVPRALAAAHGEVLIGGRRRPIAGTITMDQLMVDVGDDAVEVGDEVVLIGTQGDAEILASEWAEKLGTIPYEIVCGIGVRVPRRTRG